MASSSIQQIEAALAYVQLPASRRQGQKADPDRMVSVMGSCSFDIDSGFGQRPAASPLAQVDPPQFCKPLRRVVANAPRKPVSMVVKPVVAKRPASTSALVKVMSGASVAPSGVAPSHVVPSGVPLNEGIGHHADRELGRETLDERADEKPGYTSVEVLAETTPATTESVHSQPLNTVQSVVAEGETAPVVATSSVTPMKVKAIETVETPELPRSKMPEFKTHSNHSNPMLPLGLLQDIGKEVLTWQAQLKTVHDAIQALYAEGPIVNAWLEAMAGEAKAAANPSDAVRVSPELTMAGRYCVCGLDKSGQVWRKLCPPEQLPQVSMAIARHQKLRQLLSQKQSIDSRLQRLAQTLTVLRGRLRAY